jgi:hypothetical protein
MAAVGEPGSTMDGPVGSRENDLPPVPQPGGHNGDLDAAYKQNIRQVLSSDVSGATQTALLRRLTIFTDRSDDPPQPAETKHKFYESMCIRLLQIASRLIRCRISRPS